MELFFPNRQICVVDIQSYHIYVHLIWFLNNNVVLIHIVYSISFVIATILLRIDVVLYKLYHSPCVTMVKKNGWIFSHFYSSYNKNLISPINKLLYRRSSGAHACAYQISESVHGFVLVVLFVYTLHILIFSRNKKVISIKFLLIFPLLSITRYT